jgi:hypothetical protein
LSSLVLEVSAGSVLLGKNFGWQDFAPRTDEYASQLDGSVSRRILGINKVTFLSTFRVYTMHGTRKIVMKS